MQPFIWSHISGGEQSMLVPSRGRVGPIISCWRGLQETKIHKSIKSNTTHHTSRKKKHKHSPRFPARKQRLLRWHRSVHPSGRGLASLRGGDGRSFGLKRHTGPLGGCKKSSPRTQENHAPPRRPNQCVSPKSVQVGRNCLALCVARNGLDHFSVSRSW